MKLDLKGVYNLIYIKEGEEEKIVFQTHFRHYEFRVIHFSLTNTLVTFQCLINNVLQKWLNIICIIYLNNILIYLKNKAEHTIYITEIL